jgi:hypothetical protein
MKTCQVILKERIIMDFLKDYISKHEEKPRGAPSLGEAMDVLSERRLKFTNYLANFVANGTLTPGDKALALAYLSGIDDCNRILRYLNGEGPDIEALDFWQKAKLGEPSDYGVQNMSKEERQRLHLTEPFKDDKIDNSS